MEEPYRVLNLELMVPVAESNPEISLHKDPLLWLQALFFHYNVSTKSMTHLVQQSTLCSPHLLHFHPTIN